MMLPTDNEWDVPVLRADMQGVPVAPVMPWGAVARGSSMSGTWTFYVDDYRFASLLRHPSQLVATGCAASVEPNITLHEHAPRYEVIAATGRKRHAARLWQDAGIPVLVDLNTPARHRELCMLGVPRGWRSFATRAYAARLEDLRAEHAFATEWAGGEPRLLVVGGGAPAERLCRDLPGAIWTPDFSQQRRVAMARGGLHP